MDIPYCIVKSKSRLGALVHKKTATAVALTSVRPEVRATPLRVAGRSAAWTLLGARRGGRSGAHGQVGVCLTRGAADVTRTSRARVLQDRHDFSQLVTAIRQQYNENAKQIERTWGGGIMGNKSQAAAAKLQRALEKEAAKKALM
jgi:large subunit ribosomal protein L7Ae